MTHQRAVFVVPKEDRRGELLRRITAEYLQMPNLQLSLAQAQRLWHLEETTCEALMQRLVDDRFLRCRADGSFVLLTPGRPKPIKADLRLKSGRD
jgi:hypothetical protein